MTWGRIGTINRGLPTLFAEGRKRRPDPFDRSRERQALEPPNSGPAERAMLDAFEEERWWVR